MNRYESYKPSDIDWVGEIPTHWETVQPKYKLNRVTRPIDDEDEVITCFRDGVVTLRKNRREDGFTNSIKEHGYQQIHPGDLVVHEMDGFAGAIGISDSKGKSTPVYTVVEPDDRTDLKYIAYLLREMSQTGKIESLARSIRERTTDFRWNMWSVIYFPFPSVKEQKLISRYLDKKTSQIDSLVEKIQKKIELLKEQRSSLINHYVTKGLDPNVEMKDSGVEWIGQIPKHWELSKFKYFFEFGMGQTILKEDLTDDGIPVLSATEKYTILGYYKDPKILLKNGDLVIPARGNSIGFVKLVKEPSTSTQTTIYGRIKKQVSTVFVTFFCQGYKDHLFQFDQTAIPQITVDQVKENYLLIPPLSEQQGLCEKLKSITETNEELLYKLNQKIILMKEYRHSLISSVVTGKVRVTEDMI